MGIVSVSRAPLCAVGPWILGFFLALGSVFWEEEITSLAAWPFAAHLGGYPWHCQLIVHVDVQQLAHPHEFFCSARMGGMWFGSPHSSTHFLSFAFKLIRVTQPELIQTQKSQESQPPEETKPPSSKTVTPESTHPGRTLYQWCCQPASLACCGVGTG